MTRASIFSRYIHHASAHNQLVLQPRMGWSDPATMRKALLCIKESSTNAIGTLTLDSYTRVGDYRTPLLCLRKGQQLNGYPIVSHSVATSTKLLADVYDEKFPIQVRHGTPEPQLIFRRMIELGLDATEGGPVSYCLPYSRVSLDIAVRAWEEGCRMLADRVEQAHVESFGGCLMGQLCPPSLLVAMSILECLFFKACGITSVSLSYAQGTSYAQDRAALRLLRELAEDLLSGMDWHVVLYTYMGLFPKTKVGATRLIADSARLARQSGSERLIVKTTAESRQIPTLTDNLRALRIAQTAAESVQEWPPPTALERNCYHEIKTEVTSMLETVLNLHSNIGYALSKAFRNGWLDIPYCLHSDNRGNVRSVIDCDGRLVWAEAGKLPIKNTMPHLLRSMQPADALLRQLEYVAARYDSLS